MVLSRYRACQTQNSERDIYRMVFQRLRETLYFFWHHLTHLLVRLLPLLPLLLFANYRLLTVHGGDEQAAMKDILVLAAEFVAGLAAMAVTIRYALAVVQKGDTGTGALWREALPSVFTLAAVQILAGVLIVLGLLMFILPGIWLMGVLLPAYVIVVQEETGAIAALQAAWARFRPQAWNAAANLCALMLGLILVLSGLDALGKLLAAAPVPARLAAFTGLELIGLLFSQTVAILLVRCYELAQQEPRKAGWN
ncbi:MAG: hypothetical protein K0S16_178 [Moraxellaceae bacterium]|nr:hypothetical protein [Moraxellaceae bacterium]